jgi:hypothetical protein
MREAPITGEASSKANSTGRSWPEVEQRFATANPVTGVVS